VSQANSTEGRSVFRAILGAFTWTFGLTIPIFAAVLIAIDLMSDAVTIEPIEVPKSLSDGGYTSGVAGSRLRDAVQAYTTATERDGVNFPKDPGSIAHEDNSIFANLNLELPEHHELPDIVVPQIGLSLRVITSAVRSALHLKSRSVSGELTTLDGKYALRLRFDGRQIFSTDHEAGTPDALMIKAAPHVVRVVWPAAHAIVQYGVQKDEGLRSAEEIIARSKSDIDLQLAYLLKGNHALRNFKFEEAEEMFSRATNASLHMELALLQQGNLLLRQARTDQAVEKFRSILAINPDSAIAYTNIGIARSSEAKQNSGPPDAAKLDEAIAQYEKAIALGPGSAIAYNNLGLALVHRNQIEKAIERYRQAIDRAPGYVLAHWNLGSALESLNRFDEAVAEFRLAIGRTTDPWQLAQLHTFVGNALVLRKKAGQNDNLEGAIQAYQSAIEIVQPHCYSWAHNGLGMIWTDLRKSGNALAEFRNARQCDQDRGEDHPEITENLERAMRARDGGSIKAVSLTNR
jgi:tetratricopeptide (TPR) repeat protein